MYINGNMNGTNSTGLEYLKLTIYPNTHEA